LDPNDAYSHYQKGRALLKQGNNEDAVTEFTSALDKDRKLMKNLLFEADKFYENSKYGLAKKIVDKVLKIDSTNEQALILNEKIQQNGRSSNSVSGVSGEPSKLEG
jgi:tetratricopeptide (TPR) repeat protein